MLILHTATMLNSSIIFDNLLVNSLGFLYMISWASLVTQMVKNLPAMKETWVRSLACLGRSPGEGNDYPLQYSCLRNSMNRGAWWATSSHLCKMPQALEGKSFWVFPVCLSHNHFY